MKGFFHSHITTQSKQVIVPFTPWRITYFSQHVLAVAIFVIAEVEVNRTEVEPHAAALCQHNDAI